MGFFDIFKKKRPSAAPGVPMPPPRPLDVELLERLGRYAAVNTLVRGGQDPQRLFLATNTDADGRIATDRPTMGFRFIVERAGADHFRLHAGIDDATAYCRFTLDLALPLKDPLDPRTFDMANAPAFPLTMSKPAEHERSPLARSAFLLGWRIEGGMELASRSAPLTVDALVMGVELSNTGFAWAPTVEPREHWALLKLCRGEQSVWLALDLANGEGQLFPRRGEPESYTLAIDLLTTFT